ncbi:hypothetical protein ACHAPT_005419 [Fusarium lateritium]
MTPPTPHFHRFPNLPYEIRRQIYILATPPRLVRVKEGFPVGDEGWESDDDCEGKKELAFRQFEHELKNGPLQFNFKIHPDLAYFARNWRQQIPWSPIEYKQTQLEDYGFTSTKPAYQPWAPTPETPHIPADWVAEHPGLAFELARESWLYSEAPIPAFLHVCAESRETLKAWGYQLTFGTRSHAPRTWFHAERDILQLPRLVDNLLALACYGEFLSGCNWDIGQFDPVSLQRVKRLVLSDIRSTPHLEEEVFSVLWLFPNVTELFLENWPAEDLIDWFVDEEARTHGWTRQNKDEALGDLIREPSFFIASENIDPIAATSWFDRDSEFEFLRGDEYLIPDIQLAPSFNLTGELISEDLKGLKRDLTAELTAPMRSRAHDHWRLPEVTYIHICPESLCERLLRGRHQFWQEYSRLQSDLREGLDLEVLDQSAVEPRFRISFERIEREAWAQVGCFNHGFALADVRRMLKESNGEKNAFLRWYFDLPAIPEPSLHHLHVL